MYKESFASKLKHARMQCGFTQREAAQEIGIPYSTLANWEIARTEPDIEMLGRLIDFYTIKAQWILGTNE